MGLKSKVLFHIWRSCLAILAGLAASLCPSVSKADVYTVTEITTGALGGCFTECTISDAIHAANTNAGIDTINFAVGGTGVQTISPTSPLPPITEAVIIDGSSQDRSSPTPVIEIRGDLTTSGNAFIINASGCTLHGLIINRYKDSGLLISNVNNTTITGSWIGLDATGAAIAGNLGSGIEIVNAANTTIGGTAAGSRNVISGNTESGISITNSSGTTIDGNLIGLDSTGAFDLGNTLSGITVDGSVSTLIGGTSTGIHNIISGNTISGIKLSNGSAATIIGNLIGLNANGTAAVGNTLFGIELNSYADSIIGSSDSEVRNVISGNGSYGILISGFTSNRNQIKGNYIGTDYQGSTAIANNGGILLTSSGNTIGGTASGEGNVIAGLGNSLLPQILVSHTESNQILGNYIGTNAAGTASLSVNSQGLPLAVGIAIHDSRDNTIGSPGAGNLISGNSYGIELKASTATNFPVTGNLIQSNRIGTNASGQSAIPNIQGIVMTAITQGALSDNTIGGTNTTAAFKGNVISGNGIGDATGRGIQMVGSFLSDNVIQGNYIGTAADGTSDLGNTGPGILLDCSDTEISENRIKFNGDAGIVMASGTGNHLSQNTIFANGGLGIEQLDSRAAFGPNPPDTDDIDSGPNDLQNFPEFAITSPNRNTVEVKGTLDSTPSSSFSLEFFLNSTLDNSGYGEGETFLGSATVTTDAQGLASFSETFSTTVPTAGGITAIATDSKGNSSEFSLAVRPAKEVKPGGKVNQPPVVAVVEDVVTVSLPVYQPPRKRKPKRGITARAAKAPKRTVNYQVTVKTDARTVIKRITSKRNVVTIRNLPPGNYAANYRVSVKEGKSVVATTRPSPSTTFTVRQNTTTSSLNALFKSRWCPEMLMPACDELWP